MNASEHPSIESAPLFELPRVLVVGTELRALDQALGTIAIRLAILLEAAINLVHVMDAGLGDEAPHPGEPNEVMHRALAARVRERVAAASEILEAERVRITAIDRDGHAVVRVTLGEGRPWETLVHVAKEQRRAWIVVGARAGATLLGHTSDHVLRHATVPVLVIPEGCADTLAGSVVVAVDGSDHTRTLLRVGGELARTLGRSMVVLHVHSPTSVDAPARIADRLAEVPADVATSRVLHLLAQTSSVAQTLVEHLRASTTSILIVGAGGHGLAERVLGSTTASLAHGSPVPVLVLR